MAMSKDRVKFYIKDTYFRDYPSFMGVVQDSLGVSDTTYFGMKDRAMREGEVEVICRPSQFARFIILRSKVVTNNRIQELKAELFIPQPPDLPYDVSGNSA